MRRKCSRYSSTAAVSFVLVSTIFPKSPLKRDFLYLRMGAITPCVSSESRDQARYSQESSVSSREREVLSRGNCSGVS